LCQFFNFDCQKFSLKGSAGTVACGGIAVSWWQTSMPSLPRAFLFDICYSVVTSTSVFLFFKLSFFGSFENRMQDLEIPPVIPFFSKTNHSRPSILPENTFSRFWDFSSH
jgi:hypothetical protein